MYIITYRVQYIDQIYESGLSNVEKNIRKKMLRIDKIVGIVVL